MKITQKPCRSGLIIQPDDLQIGNFYAVYGEKHCPDVPVPVAGMAFKLMAVNLPFIVGKIAAEPSQPSVTFDVRFLDFMRVSDDYVQAQRP